ncbi:putative inorganic polyphosphate/ATP-NAD kinase [Calycomorphotria hydatis]|uniref:NAD kinase n=2 Tax=Calycomorphotria hydatis TaxID=2528027 RepID=A0A517T9R3_9PLAN|nr:putative inorganic polyphosphate/ATP-NAD kinase [Calycomorphotria hydatis]
MILSRDRSPRIQAVWDSLAKFVSSQSGVEIACSDVIEDVDPTKIEADLAVVLGGDGAILRACRLFREQQIPLIGVNLGRLGFLADLQPEEFRKQFDALKHRRYRVVEHLMYHCRIEKKGAKPEEFLGLNEVAMVSECLGISDFMLEIDEHKVATYSADGLIISTSVGSTAHSLSAGGPILRQQLPAFVVTPICPHTLTNRPLVDSADSTYRMTLLRSRGGAAVVLDGQIRRELSTGDSVEVHRADVTFKLAKLPGHNYYSTLHRKLGWAGQPRYRTEYTSD